jgi:hypothetical protein
MSNVHGCIPSGSILDDLDAWSRSSKRTEWFLITRELVANTIADMDLGPAARSEVEETFISAGLL